MANIPITDRRKKKRTLFGGITLSAIILSFLSYFLWPTLSKWVSSLFEERTPIVNQQTQAKDSAVVNSQQVNGDSNSIIQQNGNKNKAEIDK